MKDEASIRNGHVFRYEEIDEATGAQTGRGASFAGAEIQPLQYADLVRQKLNKLIKIPVRLQSARIIRSSMPGLDVDNFATGTISVESYYSSKTIGLVNGGWLPSGLALRGGTIMLPDRCTVSELFSRFRDGKTRDGVDPDFLDLFTKYPMRINPLLYALEGNLRASPTAEVVIQQIEEACAKIRVALPNAELMPSGADALNGVMGIIKDGGFKPEVQHLQPSKVRRCHHLVRPRPINNFSLKSASPLPV